MFNKFIVYLKNFDWILFFSVVLLISFGLAEIYSVALSQDSSNLADFKKQIFFVVVGIVALLLISFFDYHNFRSFSNYLYILGLILLGGVLFFGKTVRGTTGWYDFGGLSLQPVEFAKMILIVFLSRYFSSNLIKVNPFKHLLISGAGVGIFAALVLKQPDFGSALLLVFVWGFMVILAEFKKKYLLIIALIFILIFGSGWLFFFKDYQKQRILTFLNPTTGSLDESYNITQAIIAAGSGGLTGRGIGFGSQSQLKFLPESQNDFIFAVIAEELGFLGVCLVIFLFSVFFYRMLKAALRIKDDFGVFFILGVMALIFIEMFINIGMNIGLLPVVGISLPFLSYGGSAIVATLIMVGMAESVIVHSKMKY